MWADTFCLFLNMFKYHFNKKGKQSIVSNGPNHIPYAGVGLSIWGLAVLSILIFFGLATQTNCTRLLTTWRQPGLSKRFVDRI
jgi:hypothetical protein